MERVRRRTCWRCAGGRQRSSFSAGPGRAKERQAIVRPELRRQNNQRKCFVRRKVGGRQEVVAGDRVSQLVRIKLERHARGPQRGQISKHRPPAHPARPGHLVGVLALTALQRLQQPDQSGDSFDTHTRRMLPANSAAASARRPEATRRLVDPAWSPSAPRPAMILHCGQTDWARRRRTFASAWGPRPRSRPGAARPIRASSRRLARSGRVPPEASATA